MVLARRCSCSSFLFIIHFRIHLITNSASIMKLNTSNMVSIDIKDDEEVGLHERKENQKLSVKNATRIEMKSAKLARYLYV